MPVHLCFRRWYPGTEVQPDALCFPIETMDDKMKFAQFMYQHHDKMRCFFDAQINSFVQYKWSHYDNEANENVFEGHPMLSFLPVDVFDESGEHNTLFPFDLEGRMAFVNWAIETKFDDFVHPNTLVFLSSTYEVAQAESVAEGEVVDDPMPASPFPFVLVDNEENQNNEDDDDDEAENIFRQVFAEAGLEGEALERRVAARMADSSES